MLRKLYDWTMRLAGHRHATWWLGFISFIESSVFPVPPDALLLPMMLARPERSLFYATVCTVTSVLGGLLGYAIGYYLYHTVGAAIVEFYGLQQQFLTFQHLFQTYGAWILVIKGMTPIPYKLLTITAGVAELSLAVFIIASVISRAARFFLIAGLLWWFGPRIRTFIENNLTWLTTAFVVLLIGGFVAVRYAV